MAPDLLWWFLEVRQVNGLGRWETVLVRLYDHQAFHHDFKHVDTKTFEDRLMMPPGRYLVFFGLRDDSRFHYPDGTIKTGQITAGRSIIVNVL